MVVDPRSDRWRFRDVAASESPSRLLSLGRQSAKISSTGQHLLRPRAGERVSVPDDDVTLMLQSASEGDTSAADALLPVVYDELRQAAGHLMNAERSDHTLEPTALVHEAYLKLIDQTRVQWQGRAHFFAVAAQAIRRILVDHARAKGRAKRGGGRSRLSLDEAVVASFERSVDMLALDEALEALAETHPRHARIVEARFFGGLTIEETATVLGISTATVEREWRYARAVLFRMLSDESSQGNPRG